MSARERPFAEVDRVIREAAAEAFNAAYDAVAAEAINEAPLLYGPLRASAVYPGNDVDGTHRATADKLEANITFNTEYAAAQHEGMAEHHLADGRVVLWVVRNYTTPGTKSHYLEDPLKAMIPRLERVVGLNIEKRLSERYG